MLACVPLVWWGFVLSLDGLLHLAGGGLEARLDGPLQTCLLGSPLASLRWALGLGGGTALALLVTLVALGCAADSAGYLGHLRRTGTLQELASTHLTPERMVDGLARHAAARAGRLLMFPALLSAIFTLFAGSQAPPAGWIALALAPIALGFYLLPAAELWLRQGDRGPEGHWLVRLALAAVLACLALSPVLAEAGAAILAGPWAGAAAGALLSVPALLFCRALAIQALDENSPLRRAAARMARWLAPHRSRAYRDATANPLLFRERAVRSGSWLARHGWALAACAGVALLGTGVPALILTISAVAAAAFAALLSSSRSLMSERQQRTLEVLQQSGVTSRDFVQGWTTAVAASRQVDVGLVTLVTAGVALARGEQHLALGALLLGPVGVAAVESAAAWGLAYAGSARTRLEIWAVSLTYSSVSGLTTALAMTVLGPPLLATCWATGMGEGEYRLLLWLLVWLSFLAGALATAALGRYSAINALTHRPGRTGFVADP
jgi:hypothetical protein